MPLRMAVLHMDRAEITAINHPRSGFIQRCGCIAPMRAAAIAAHGKHPYPPPSVARHLARAVTQLARPKMIKTFSLSALFFLSVGLLFVNATQLPIA